MNVRTSDVKKTRAPRVPYTPPAARRSAGDSAAISGKIVEQAHDAVPETGSARQRGSGSIGRQQQQGKAGKQLSCQQKAAEENDNDEARRSPTGSKGATTAGADTGATAKKSGGEGRRSHAESDGREAGRVSDSVNTCQPPSPTPPGLNEASPPKVAGAAGTVGAAGTGSRRKPRQAWSQYVPPGRRGAGCSESVRSPVPENSPSTATVVDSRGGGSSGGNSSGPPLNQKAIPQRNSTVVAVDDKPVAVAGAGAGDAGAGADEQTASAETTTPLSLSSSSDACYAEDNETTSSTAPEEGQESCLSHSPLPSPPPAERNNRLAARETTATRPPPMAACEESEARTQNSPAAAAAATDAFKTPSKEPSNDNSTKDGELSKSVDDHDRDQLPPFKPPSARYIPPGRRKALDAQAAAAAAKGDDAAAGDGMGPLWTSRAPVRVSQRERPPREASPPARPSPSRVASVVSGGMSAYGANISEYSEEMSREQVEACTAVVSNFPAALPPGQRDPMLQPFVSLGGLVVWPRPDEALVTFATPALARQAVSTRNNRSTVLVVELLSQTRPEKRAGYRRVELARPGRPPADVSSGSRLILGALGIRRPKPKTSDASQARNKSANSKGGVRGRGAKNVQAPPAESTDSWDM